MKRIICLALAIVLCAALLVSCSKNTSTSGDGNGTSASTSYPLPEGYENHVAPKANELDMSVIDSMDNVTESVTETDYVIITVKDYGQIVVRLYPEVAPITVQNFKSLVNKKFYDGLIFHRVISGFMIQGGDPEGTGMGGSGTSIPGEFTNNGFENNLPHVRGTVAMARSTANSASSQFYICHKNSGVAHLDGDYAAFGFVVYGIEVVDKIAKVSTDSKNNKPLRDVVITSVRFATVALEK